VGDMGDIGDVDDVSKVGTLITVAVIAAKGIDSSGDTGNIDCGDRNPKLCVAS